MTAAPQLPLSNIVNISVATSQTGVNDYNTSNLALFTGDSPNATFPSSQGYQLYLSPAQVALDFGSTSTTYQMAAAVFGQQPNILTGGGCLVVIPFLSPTSGITATTTASSDSLTTVSSTTASRLASRSPGRASRPAPT